MIVTEIRCDACDAFGDGSGVTRPHMMRLRLAERGWAVALPGGGDLCPKCNELDRERRRARRTKGAKKQ